MKKYLVKQAKENNVSFHMPGHKGEEIYRKYGYGDFLDHIMNCDITEIKGADNLFMPDGIIRDTENLYQSLYGSKRSFLLVNGTTGGILASVMACVSPGKKLLMSRGCHKAVYNGVRLGNIEPVYIQPMSRTDMGIMGEISPEEVKKALEKDQNIEAVILPSPNYYGVCSDIKAISKVVHDAGKVLIVDQAHGAHLKFFHQFNQGDEMPKGGEDLGGDIVINSIHKTLGSFTQSGVLNLMTDRVTEEELADKLQLVQSTSPSYILMCSLAIAGELIKNHGEELFKEWKENLDWFYNEAKDIEGIYGRDENLFDRTKIDINLRAYNISGKSFNEYLESRGIITEMVTGDIVMAMTGIGNKREDYQRLLEALKEKTKDKIANKRLSGGINGFDIPTQGRQRRCDREKEWILLKDSTGRVSGGTITPYPPGIPFICPGEEIGQEVIDRIEKLRGEDKLIYGISETGHIHVYKN